MKRIACIALLLCSSVAFAQVKQTADCSRGCSFVTDSIDIPLGAAVPTYCLMFGGPISPIKTLVRDGASLAVTPPLPAGKVCYFPKVVLAPGAYMMTAAILDANLRLTEKSLPLDLTVSVVLAAPTNLRVLAVAP